MCSCQLFRSAVHLEGGARLMRSCRWMLDRGKQTTNQAVRKVITGEETLDRALDQVEHSVVGVATEIYASLLRRFGIQRALSHGMRVHAHMATNGGHDRSTFLGNLLVQMYGRCGSLEHARAAFAAIPKRNVFSWNIVIAAYAQNGHSAEIIQLFDQMQRQGVVPDRFTFASVLSASSSIAEGKAIHERIASSGLESDVVLETALFNMYTKCGSLDEARNLFRRMRHKDLVSWTAMITACAQEGHGREALELYQEMDARGLQPDPPAYASVLGACASLGAIAEGKAIHARILSSKKTLVDVGLYNAIVNMYAKCGMLQDARSLFHEMCSKDVYSWNIMIAAYAQHGHPAEVLDLYAEMELDGVEPDAITFTSILYACSHAGLQKQGRLYFTSMSAAPVPEHYHCMVDLLGRAGRLDEAEELIKNLPYEPSYVPWTSLLSACRMHRDVVRAARVAEHLAKLLPEDSGPYVLISNIYATTGRRGDALKVRQSMQDNGVKKQPGCSFIEIQDKVHEFIAGDTSHPQNKEIRSELQRLLNEMEERGYVPDTSEFLLDVTEEKKKEMLCYHSEKLAIAFGLIATEAGTPLRIFKNLRVCPDCHAAAKFISNVRKREIIVRDANRFHCFKEGLCSCGDYW